MTRVRGTVRPEKYADVVVALMDRNVHMVIGSFDIDFEDGEITFRSAFMALDMKIADRDIIALYTRLGVSMYHGPLNELGDFFSE